MGAEETTAFTKISDLPKGWAWLPLGSLSAPEQNAITDGPFGSKLKTEHYTRTGPRVVRLQNIGDGVFKDAAAHISDAHFASLQKHRIDGGDLAIALLGTVLPRACVIPDWLGPAIVKADCIRFRSNSNLIKPEYLSHALNCQATRDRTAAVIHGVGRPRLSLLALRSILVAVAPLNEQTRIVDALDELFSNLDAGMAALERVREKLKLYRASVLKAAVEGTLTADWRAQHPDIEPASELLDRILVERRFRWEEDQLAKFKDKSQEPPKYWKANYNAPANPNVTRLPALPEGWVWSNGDALFGFVTSGSRGWARYCAEDGAIFIRMGNLDHASIALDLRQVQRVNPPPGAEGLRTSIKPRDILISITADVGMIALAPDGIEEAYINQHVALARPVDPALAPFVAWYLASPNGGQQRLRDLQRGATKVGLGLDDIRAVAVPVPPLEEQKAIVEAVEDQLSVIDHLEAHIDAKLKAAQSLRQAILRHAFTGQLVPQDQNDEPAGELLKRIAAERAARAKEVVKPEQRKKKKAETL